MFKIDEGQEVKVRRVVFLGNESITDDELTKIMATRETGFFSFLQSNNKFNQANFDEDLTRLQAWYYDKGYLTMSVGKPRVELTADRAYVDIFIPVEEGERYKIGDIEVVRS
ncbi:MAG: POTRA domain-containing protein [Polyangiales bacterium]